MVDLTRDDPGDVWARLLDLVPGHSGGTYTTWHAEHGETFRKRVEIRPWARSNVRVRLETAFAADARHVAVVVATCSSSAADLP